MSLSSDVSFSFQCDSISEDEFHVLQFSGTETLGDLYQFDIQLISYSDTLDTDALLEGNCTLTIDSYGKKRAFNGILSNFNYLKTTENGYLFEATLVPRLWLLTQFTTNEVYLGLSLSETLTLLFDEAGLTSDEYDLSLISSYRPWDYRCQFGESHYNFLKRITEREGVYFFFDQSNQKDKAIFCNKNNQHPAESLDALYSPITGNSYSEGAPVIFQWTQNNQRVPKEVIVKDYNNDQPSVDLAAKALIDSSGLGEVFRYCDNLLDLDEAKELADIRAEELLMQKTRFFGSSLDVEIAPAYPLNLSGHPLGKLNTEYTPISVSHSGYAPDLSQIHQINEQPYSNTIQAIHADIQFRPEQRTEKPRFYGVLNAIVDSEGDGQYAHLDSRGRYKVVLPFDRKGRDGAQASWWIPMSQPNAGDNSGMHFPLLKGAEVLLSFIGGDPDRPVITGAVPNASKPSVVREDNHTQNKIKTAANNIIEMEDEADSERIKLYSPNSNSYFHLGAANPINGNGIMMMTSGGYYQEVGGGYQVTLVTSSNLSDALHEAPTPAEGEDPADMTDGTSVSGTQPLNLLNNSDIAKDLLNERNLTTFQKADDTGKLGDEMTAVEERSGKYFIHRENGEKYFWNDGNTHTFGGAKDFSYGNGYEVSYVEPDDVSDWDGSFPIDEHNGDPDKLLISKTIGDTYDYQRGVAKDRLYGESYSVHVGHAAMEGLALTSNISAGIYGFNLGAELSGVHLGIDLAGVKVDFEASIAKFSLSYAAIEKESLAGNFEQGVKGEVLLESGEEFRALSAPFKSGRFDPAYEEMPESSLFLNHNKKISRVAVLTDKSKAKHIEISEPELEIVHDGTIKIHAATTSAKVHIESLDAAATAAAQKADEAFDKALAGGLTTELQSALDAANTEKANTASALAAAKASTSSGKLEIKAKEVTLDGETKIDISTKTLTLKADTSAKVDSKKVDLGQGSNTVAIASAGTTIKSGGNSVKVASAGVDLTSSAKVSVKGTLVQLG